MNVLAFDTETTLIRPGVLAPDLVCVSYQALGEEPQLLVARDATEMWFSSAISGCGFPICGHNVSYDLGVLCQSFPHLRSAVFRAYEEDRIADTMVRQRLLDTASGIYRGQFGEKGRWIKHEYTLQALARRCAGIPIKKEGFRLFYGPFKGVPLGDWTAFARDLQKRARAVLGGGPSDPDLEYIRACLGDDKRFASELAGMVAADPEEVVIYPLDDARATLAVYQSQEAHKSFLSDQYRQARAEWALHLSSAWGLRTDLQGVEKLRGETQTAYDEVEAELKEVGLVKPDGVRNTKAAKSRMVRVCEEEGITLRRTDTHGDSEAKCKDIDGNPVSPGADECAEHVSLDADACTATGDEALAWYAEVSTLKKVLSNDIEMLLLGMTRPVHPKYGFAETGRTTSSKPNIQNVGKRIGIRECFVPREGRLFVQADYPQLELYALAQCCMSWLQRSALADAINAGLDAHTAMAANILGTTYEDTLSNIKTKEVKAARNTAKVANFGFPGGLGLEKLCLFAKKQYKVILTVPQAKSLKEQWFATWPEMPHYFARINALCDNDSGRATVESLFTKRTRGGASYCAACNNGFQALGSDCAKNAMWLVAKAQYAEPSSPLFDARTVAFVHDEIIAEVRDDDRAHDAAYELARLMAEGANVYLPDVPIPVSKINPLLMRRWSKDAVPVNDSSGRLIPWQAA